MQFRVFEPNDEQAVIQLWEECGLTRPWNNPKLDIQRKLREQPELFFVGILDNKLIATAMAGYDGHRSWVYYLAVRPDHQKSSYGRSLMAHVENELRNRGCPKINLQIRNSNLQAIDFYRKLGYLEDEVVSFGKRLIKD